MTYSERFSDQERMQVYSDLVFSGMTHYPSGESAVLAEMLSGDHAERPKRAASKPRFSWLGILRLPFFAQPSLT